MVHALPARKGIELNVKSHMSAWGLSGIITFIASIPHSVHVLIVVACGMVVMDTLTGLAAAIVCRKLRSKTMREKLVLKLCQYAIIISLGWGMWQLADSWILFGFAFFAIILIEVSSMLENLAKMQLFGGANMGPASGFVKMIGGFFDLGNEGMTVVSTATMFPSNKDEDTVIVSTSKETLPRPKP